MNAGDLRFARLRHRISKMNLLGSFQMSKESLALGWGDRSLMRNANPTSTDCWLGRLELFAYIFVLAWPLWRSEQFSVGY